MLIKLKASTDVGKEVELYEEVQYIAAKLKFAGCRSMLEAKTEYVVHIVKHLPKHSIKDQIKTGKTTWNKFYQHLMLTAKITRWILTNEAEFNPLTKDKLPGEKSKCTNCGKPYGGQ